MLKELKEDLTSQNTTLKTKYQDEMTQNSELKSQEAALNQDRIQELEDLVRELEEKSDSIQSQAVKDQAVSK